MKANYKDKIQQAEVALGNLYDMNKQMMENEPPLAKEGLVAAYDNLLSWFKEKNMRYFMLLCNELKDYTIFNLDKSASWAKIPLERCEYAAGDVLECMSNRGTLLSVELQDTGAWELWIRNAEGCFAYYLFPYGDAVIEY